MQGPVSATCPVCGAVSSHRRFQARNPHDGIVGRWWVRECAECESLFLEDVPPAERLAALYPQDTYYAYTLPRTSRIKRFLRTALGAWSSPNEPQFPAPGSVLDFGCGAGEALLEFRARGWRCAGVEISAVARGVAESNGLDVRESISGPNGFPDAAFDYVRANHSLEHVVDPGAVLAELWRVLKPGGTLFLGVPTATSENARLFGPDWWYLTPPLHPFVPSTRGITGLVERHGFRVGRVSTNSDYGSTAGSLQIKLNRGTGRRSTEGVLFALKPLLLLGHWLARLQDWRGVGDKLELIALKPGTGAAV